jgi:hypothetical protein
MFAIWHLCPNPRQLVKRYQRSQATVLSRSKPERAPVPWGPRSPGHIPSRWTVTVLSYLHSKRGGRNPSCDGQRQWNPYFMDMESPSPTAALLLSCKSSRLCCGCLTHSGLTGGNLIFSPNLQVLKPRL